MADSWLYTGSIFSTIAKDHGRQHCNPSTASWGRSSEFAQEFVPDKQAPQYVFGTFGVSKPEPIHHALNEGYLAFDTAQLYDNEREVGEAIRSYSGKVDRKDLFIITKVKEPKSTVEETYQTIKDSVETIGLGGYVDLFLVHNPNAGPEGRKIQWLALERAQKEGLTRTIGVSN
jgi:diketogulonate reductase-like aldo/keto reductase